MISSLTGTAEHIGLDRAVINVHGVGYLISATPQTLAKLRLGEQATVHTELIIRDDAQTLYGFSDAEEREIFNTMLTVSGIGPKIGLAVLSVYTPEEVRLAVSQDDDKTFSKVPGIGPKTARRIILELSGKLIPAQESPAPGAGATPGATSQSGGGELWREQVQEALIGLGWTEKDALRALELTLSDQPELVESGDVAHILRATLRNLGQGQTQSKHLSSGGRRQP